MKLVIPFLNYFFFLLLGGGILLFSSCDKLSSKNSGEPDKRIQPAEPEIMDTLSGHELKEESVPVPVLKYHLDSISQTSEVDSLKNRFDREQQEIILALNRIDENRLGTGLKIIIPDSVGTDIMMYSPFPESIEILEVMPKAVLVAQRIQAFGLYENGKLIRWGPVSSGKKTSPTPNGLHYGNFKAKRKISNVNSSWILPYYFNFMNFEGVGVHQYALPGYAASHACVRLRLDDARFIYDWARQWKLDETGRKIIRNGTPFMVFGEYDHNTLTPWLDLATDPGANRLLPQEMELVKAYVEDYLMDPRNCEEEIPVEKIAAG